MTAESSNPALAEVIVTLAGTILDVRHVGPGAGGPAWSTWLPRFLVGEGPSAHLPVAFAGQAADGVLALVESAGPGIRVRLASGLTGVIERDGVEVTIAALLARGETAAILRPGDSASVLVGPALVTIRVQACTPVEKFRAAIDRPLWISQGGALALLAVLMVVIQRTPPTIEAPRFDDPDVQANLIRYLKPAEDAVSEPRREVVAGPVIAAPRTEPAKSEPTPVNETAAEVPSPEALRAVARVIRGEDATDEARRSGILALADFMRSLEKAAAEAEVAKEHYEELAKDDSAFIAAAEQPAPTVLTGLGLADIGGQGGGLAAGAIDFDWSWLIPADGLRSMNPKKLRARAEREKFAAREPVAGMPERRQSVVWTASVGRDLIRGVVNRNKPDVRRCFRDGMLVNPALAGEVEVAFTIQSDGAVAYASVARSTLSDAAVEACVTETVKRWKFPTFVASGGDVDVRFPFTVGKA